MWGITAIVVAFVLGLAAFGFVIGTPILGVPIAIVGIAIIAAVDFQRRRRQAKEIHDFREQAKTEQVEFTPRDEETLVSK
jgi:hypothetical protein